MPPMPNRLTRCFLFAKSNFLLCGHQCNRLPLLAIFLFLVPHPGIAADNSALLTTYQQWKTLRDNDAPLPSFTDATQFLKNHPTWPQEKIIRSRAESAALLQFPAELPSFCSQFPPLTGRGMVACVLAGAGDAPTRTAWLHQAWRMGDFNADEEKKLLARFGTQFTVIEHRNRLDRLLFEEKTAAAKRMLPLVAPQYQLLAEARLALMSDASNAIAKLHNVPAALRNDPGLILNRIQWRSRQGLDDGVVEMFLSSPANPPNADLWWNLRASTVRQALRERKPDAALRILERHGELNPENLADALFLDGWIRMEYKGDARTGYKKFYALYKAVATPVSKARAAYWAGRAAHKNGNPDIARQWYAKAAEHPTVFYGQLAQHTLKPSAPLTLPAKPTVTDATRQKFEANELAQIIPLLAQSDGKRMLPMFLKALSEQADTEEEFASISEIATNALDSNGGVKVAKLALRKQIVVLETGWPIIPLPDALGVEPALALAIIRQESEFDPAARSGADARGMMQLLPGTGAHVAKKLDLGYDADDLWDSARNITLGSTYLGQMINGFDGSYVLGIASYNAGPGNVRKWLAREGFPPHDEAGAVNWIESIPFSETRNYVMRVIENLQIYRQLHESNHPLNIAKDITR